MPESDFVRPVRGVDLFERRLGGGPPVVALHGGPGAHHDYLRPGFDFLADGHTLIYYDQRGGGRSPVARDVAVGWREQVADLEALRDIWGLDRLTLAGYSWGGLLALLYAIENPGRVERLALISPAPAWRKARDQFERRFTERSMTPALQAARKELRESGLREQDPVLHQKRLFELAIAGYFHDPVRAHDLTPFRITERTQKEVWASLGEFDLRSALGRLSLPALVVHGDDDPIPVESASVVAALLGAEFHVLQNCGHVPYIEAYADFSRIVGTFLS